MALKKDGYVTVQSYTTGDPLQYEEVTTADTTLVAHSYGATSITYPAAPSAEKDEEIEELKEKVEFLESSLETALEMISELSERLTELEEREYYTPGTGMAAQNAALQAQMQKAQQMAMQQMQARGLYGNSNPTDEYREKRLQEEIHKQKLKEAIEEAEEMAKINRDHANLVTEEAKRSVSQKLKDLLNR